MQYLKRRYIPSVFYLESIKAFKLGRFLSIDPYTNKFPALSPYIFAANSPISAIDKDGKYIFIVTKPDIFGKPIVKRATAEDLKDIPGFEGLYKTKSGRKYLNKYLNSKKKDLYLTVKSIKNTQAGGETGGQSLDPAVTNELTNKKGEFDPGSKIDELRGSQNGVPPGLTELERNYRNFSGVPLREGATESAFMVIDPHYGKTEAEKVETAGHEMIHLDLHEKGIVGGHHESQEFKDGLNAIKTEYNEIEKAESKKEAN